LGTYRDGLPVSRQSPIQVVTGPGVEQLRTLIETNVFTTISRRHLHVFDKHGVRFRSAIWFRSAITYP